MQRVLLFSGWSRWNLGIEDVEKEKEKQGFGNKKKMFKKRTFKKKTFKRRSFAR